MAKPTKDARPSPRLPKGLRDIESSELRAQTAMIDKIRAVYERYGFEPLSGVDRFRRVTRPIVEVEANV